MKKYLAFYFFILIFTAGWSINIHAAELETSDNAIQGNLEELKKKTVIGVRHAHHQKQRNRNHRSYDRGDNVFTRSRGYKS